MTLSASITDFFRSHHLENTTGIVLISGGPDSVALAHLLVGLVRDVPFERLILAHLNHQLRGDESDADERFVQELPSRWLAANDVPLTCRTERRDIAAIAKAEHANLESIARRERYRWAG